MRETRVFSWEKVREVCVSVGSFASKIRAVGGGASETRRGVKR